MNDFPAALQQEWDTFRNFKAAPFNRSKAERNGTGPLSRRKGATALVRSSKWRLADDAVPGSAQKMRTFLAGFFGYLCLPQQAAQETLQRIDSMTYRDGSKVFRDSEDAAEFERRDWAIAAVQGKGMNPDGLSLALLSDADLILDYLEFMRHRTGGFSGDTTFAFQTVKTLLREGTGYLRQQSHFRSKLPPGTVTDDAEWERWCAENYLTLTRQASDLAVSGEIGKNRDPSVPIADILAMDQPIKALHRLAQAIRHDPRSTSKDPVTRAISFRNYLLVRLMTFNPLRIKHFAMMRFNTHLYRTTSGAWRLRFPAAAFKNEKGALKKDYDVPVDASLWADIELYLNEHRPHLHSSEEADGFVFLKDPGARKKGAGFGQRGLRMIIHRLAAHYLDALFGPHAFRHIVATTILKLRPNDWQAAADALHDTLETVRKAYAHLEVAQGIERVNSLISGLIATYDGELA